MKVENQVCTLKQALTLKNLGIAQQSLFYYIQDKTPTNSNQHLYGWAQENMPIGLFYGKKSNLSGNSVCYEYSAFTVAELGIMLYNLEGFVGYDDHTNKWMPSHNLPLCETEAQARAEFLIYCLESEDTFINADNCNERLCK